MPRYVAAGGFERDTNYLPTRITADGVDGWPVEPDRYRLVVARACPWANRAIIVRRLLGLEPVLSLAITGPVHDERSWDFAETTPGGRDPVLGIERLEEAYLRRDPTYDKGITVPAIVDIPTGQRSTCRRSGAPTTAPGRPTSIPRTTGRRSMR
jgi:glutathionyl-hydroquinone reductase